MGLNSWAGFKKIIFFFFPIPFPTCKLLSFGESELPPTPLKYYPSKGIWLFCLMSPIISETEWEMSFLLIRLKVGKYIWKFLSGLGKQRHQFAWNWEFVLALSCLKSCWEWGMWRSMHKRFGPCSLTRNGSWRGPWGMPLSPVYCLNRRESSWGKAWV